MSIDEAIKELNFLYECLKKDTDPRLLKAIQLGIEALKRIKMWRTGQVLDPYFLLPGETKK